jgi:GNAT superfamily N-acetyltransferase
MRGLNPGDAGAIAELIGACDETYLEFAPQGWQPPSADQETAKWIERLSEAGRWSCGAFDAQGALVGFAAMRQARTDEEPSALVPGIGHLGALFVHPRRWREGIAAHLLDRAEAAMREQGFQIGRLRTPERAPARRFYERHGWSSTGESWYREDFGMTEVGYEKRLADRDP